MKKLLMLTAALCTFASAADAARPFNGWSVGVNGGWNQDRLSDIDNIISDLNSSATFNTGFAGIHFDWTNSKANAFLFGFGLGLGYNFGSPSETVFEQGNVKLNLEQKRGFSTEINTRLGWNFDNKWTLYGILAARGQRTKTTLSAETGGTVTDSESVNKFRYGFAPGLGFDVRVNESWSVGGQYKYYFDQSISVKNSNLDKDNSVKIRSHNALIRVSYHF